MKTNIGRQILLFFLILAASVSKAAVTFRPIGNSFNSVEVRYIRDFLNGNSVNNASHWVEIQAFDQSGTNLAQNKQVKMFTAAGAEFSPANLSRITDGSLVASEYVSSSPNTNVFVQVDLGSVQRVSYLKLFHYWNVNNPRTYYGTKTEISTDGVNWTTVFDSKSSNGSVISTMYRESSNGRTIYLADKISRNDNITLQTTGGTVTFPSVTEQVAIGGQMRTLTNFHREGYVFSGWNTKADGSGTHVAAGENCVPTQTVYYAEWQPAPCTVQLDLNAQNGTEPIRYIRDFLNKNTTNNSSHWVEIQAFNSSDTNVALGKTVRAYTAAGEEFSPANLSRITDGSLAKNEYVSVGTNSDMYVVVDLGNVVSVAYLKLFHYWETPNLRAYFGNKTQVSADGVNWTTVFDSQNRQNAVGGKMYNETEFGHTIFLGNKVAIAENTEISVPQGTKKIYEPFVALNGAKLPFFTREGYTLSSWNTKADGSGKKYPVVFDVSAKNFGSNTTLFAQWSPNQLTIDPNGGTYEKVASSRSVDVPTLPFALKQPEHETQFFRFWTGNGEKFISNYQNIPCSSGIEQTVSGSVSYELKNASDYTFSDQFTVNFWAYKSSWANSATRFRVNFGTANSGFDLVLNTQTTNVRFEYFGTQKRIFTTNKASNSLAGGWHMFTFTFDGNVWRGYIDSQEVCNSTRSVTAAQGNVFGTYFQGKIKNVCLLHHAMSDGEVALQYKNPNVAYYFGTQSDANLTANWQSGYRVVFNSNGGVGEMSPMACLVGTTYSLSTNVFARENWTFEGWNTQPDGSGTTYANQAEITNLAPTGGTITLFAQWRYSAVELTVDPNGGTFDGSSAAKKLPLGTQPIEIAKPTHASKSFAGWSGESEKFLSNHQNFAASTWLETSVDTAAAYIIKPYNANYNYDCFTVNVWVCNEDWSTFTAAINGKNCSVISCMQSGGWKIYAANDGQYIGFQCSTKNAAKSVTINSSSAGARTWSSLSAGWHMFTLVYDGTAMTAYLDGEIYCLPVPISGEIKPASDQTMFVVGGDPNGTGGLEANGYFRGKMKNVGFVNYPMSASDVKRQFQNPNTTYFFPQGENGTLKAEWNADCVLQIQPNGGIYRGSTLATINEIVTSQPFEIAVPTKADSTFYAWSGGTNSNTNGEKFLSHNQNFVTSSGKEVDFNGSYAVKLKPYNANYNYKQFTANVWVYNADWKTFATQIGNTNCTLIGCMQSGGWKIYAANSGKYIGFQGTTAGGAASALINSASAGAKTWANLSAGWHMLTFVYNGKLATAYLDGEPYCEPIPFVGEINPQSDGAILAIGGDTNGSGGIEENSYFKGKMKNVGFINYALTPEQVLLLFQNPEKTYYFYQGNNK